MHYEVDIFAVGEESKSGDAISMRFGNFVNDPSDQTIVVIDGGFKDSGKALVKRIQQDYGSNYIDLIISSHPDNDHVSGLHVLLEELEVGELWMHRPWNMSQEVKRLATENRSLTTLGLSSKLKKSLESAYDLEQLALKKGVKVSDPFQGRSEFGGVLHVLGPSRDFYCSLVGNFERSNVTSIPQSLKRLISELWHVDELVEPDPEAVSPRNNSSTIILARFEDTHFLFTGDAGVRALEEAVNYADQQGYDIASDVNFIQVPHHGSKRNLGPSILNRLVGSISQQGAAGGKVAFISAAPNCPKHPSPRVKNALIRRGVNVASTCGDNHCYKSSEVPTRSGWGPVSYDEFIFSYEEE